MKRKSSLKTLQNKLWLLVKKFVFDRDHNTCQRCVKVVSGQNRHPAHVIPQSHGNSLKYDPDNILTLCFGDHIQWAHLNPLEFAAWFQEKFPERFEKLMREKNKIVKLKREDYERMILRIEAASGTPKGVSD